MNTLNNYESIDAWTEANPMPVITDLESFEQAVAKSFWALRLDEAATVIEYEEEYPLNVLAYKWNVEQAIINRHPSKTMLEAGLEYVSNLTANLP